MRLESITQRYQRVVMLGDSMGATAALLMAPLATAVQAFCPQVPLHQVCMLCVCHHCYCVWFAEFTAMVLRPRCLLHLSALSYFCGS